MLVYDIMEVIFGYVDIAETIRNINQIIDSEVIKSKMKSIEDITTHSHDTEYIQRMVGSEIASTLTTMNWKSMQGSMISFKDFLSKRESFTIYKYAKYKQGILTIYGNATLISREKDCKKLYEFQDREFKFDYPVQFGIKIKYRILNGKRYVQMSLNEIV